jgi:hypothetical protein
MQPCCGIHSYMMLFGLGRSFRAGPHTSPLGSCCLCPQEERGSLGYCSQGAGLPKEPPASQGDVFGTCTKSLPAPNNINIKLWIHLPLHCGQSQTGGRPPSDRPGGLEGLCAASTAIVDAALSCSFRVCYLDQHHSSGHAGVGAATRPTLLFSRGCAPVRAHRSRPRAMWPQCRLRRGSASSPPRCNSSPRPRSASH